MRRTEALKIISRVLRQPTPECVPADLIQGAAAAYFDPQAPERPKPWAMETGMLAMRIAAQLPLTDDVQLSPLARAEDAKHRRDLIGELGALTAGHDQLTSALWYPARPGDLVHVHYEQAGDAAAFGETYLVAGGGSGGLLSLRLLAHTCPLAEDEARGFVGCFETETADCPLYELWFEAGPHRLTIVRDGQVVHPGGAR
jgi:hypothetical protein